eukprot:1546225-Amphidinium_carterae.1
MPTFITSPREELPVKDLAAECQYKHAASRVWNGKSKLCGTSASMASLCHPDCGNSCGCQSSQGQTTCQQA